MLEELARCPDMPDAQSVIPRGPRKQETATAAMASIEDAADCGERADALVSSVLAGVMRQHRGGDGLRQGTADGDAGELLGAGREGRP